MHCSIKLHTTDQTTPHPLLFSPEKLKFWQHGGIHLPAALYQFTVGCGSRGGPPTPTLCHTHAYQSPCSIIEICIIHESFKSFLHVTARLSLSLALPIRCQLYSYQLCGFLQKRRHVFIHLTQATFTWRKAGEWKCFRLHVYLLVSGLLHAYLELQECISGRGQRCKF